MRTLYRVLVWMHRAGAALIWAGVILIWLAFLVLMQVDPFFEVARERWDQITNSTMKTGFLAWVAGFVLSIAAYFEGPIALEAQTIDEVQAALDRQQTVGREPRAVSPSVMSQLRRGALFRVLLTPLRIVQLGFWGIIEPLAIMAGSLLAFALPLVIASQVCESFSMYSLVLTLLLSMVLGWVMPLLLQKVLGPRSSIVWQLFLVNLRPHVRRGVADLQAVVRNGGRFALYLRNFGPEKAVIQETLASSYAGGGVAALSIEYELSGRREAEAALRRIEQAAGPVRCYALGNMNDPFPPGAMIPLFVMSRYIDAVAELAELSDLILLYVSAITPGVEEEIRLLSSRGELAKKTVALVPYGSSDLAEKLGSCAYGEHALHVEELPEKATAGPGAAQQAADVAPTFSVTSDGGPD